MILRFLISLYYSISHYRLLGKIIDKENLIYNLSVLFGAQFKYDWLNRPYVVLNPNVKDGQFNTDRVLEIDGNDAEYIKRWVIEKLLSANSFIIDNNLFDIVSYKVNRLDEFNYLFYLYPIQYTDTRHKFKWAFIELLIIIGLIFGYLLFFAR